LDSASFQFVLFGLAAAIVSNFSRSRVWRSIVLFVVSIVFLGLLSHSPIAFLPLLGFLALGYGALVLLQRGRSRLMAWSILGVILVYIWLKKYTFLPEGAFLHYPYFTLGLSYIFFRVLHLLIGTGDRDEKQRIGLGAYLLYTLNFTTLLSGPIQRYDEFARDQFAAEPIVLGPRTIGLQVERIIRGFFKVSVLAMLFQAFQEDALVQISEPLPLPLKLWAANFDRPFSASSFIDFWNRWHITLSTWLKTYVYNPLLLALMRRISWRRLEPFLGVFCFFVTFFLVGVWHGRTSEFMIFGVLQGGGVAANKLWQLGMARGIGRKSYKVLAKNPIYIAFGRGLTFSWFAFTLFWFWGDWKRIDQVFAALSIAQWLVVWLAIWLCATTVLALWEALRGALLSIKTAAGPVLTSRYVRVVYASALGLAAFVMTVLLNQPAPDIVYKAF